MTFIAFMMMFVLYIYLISAAGNELGKAIDDEERGRRQ